MLHPRTSLAASLVITGLLTAVQAQYYKVDTKGYAIKTTASTIAYDLMLLYEGNRTGKIPGILPGPPAENKGNYYWWQGGAMMGTYIDYWHLTGDTSYNDVVMQGILHQVGENRDFMPRNHTASLGNDDQGFWGMTAMLAAENKFPDPPRDKPQWLALAQAVWATQADSSRHDHYCNGGMRWQIPFSNAGYDYKNNETWDWLWGVGYIDHKSWLVYDGGRVQHNCTDINKATFSYNAAILTQGAAFMYNYTNGDKKWGDRVDNLVDSMIKNFFKDGAAYEVPCESTPGTCTADMLTFKGYVHRWLSVVAQIVPHTADKILPVLEKSAQAAAKQCTGRETGRTCGFYWTGGKFVDPGVDKTTGAGEYMSALAAVSSLLIKDANPPTTNDTGGTSKGSPNGGFAGGDNGQRPPRPITTADKAGAGILTLTLVFGAVCTFFWMGFMG
ncbi:Mannan endo-1,6-alpha-mannosidase DCW1 [Beauveria bassiana D1-5]|uniref:Mannan endo-1,6-alpha-mannosidase n=1 Tax=Beauveria bassiana D1-5 TaxID=1245745 RepID=A0A0A2VBG6_BEABA|nr:Mannan endo-1,6-alpha-mannosidase DCW1 [Beauveria bassiana D1-5]